MIYRLLTLCLSALLLATCLPAQADPAHADEKTAIHAAPAPTASASAAAETRTVTSDAPAPADDSASGKRDLKRKILFLGTAVLVLLLWIVQHLLLRRLRQPLLPPKTGTASKTGAPPTHSDRTDPPPPAAGR